MIRFAMMTALCMCVGAAVAEDKKADQPDMEKIKAAMKKHADVGDAHKVLAKIAGKWEFTGKHYMPGGKSADMTGTCESKLVLGGLYLADHVKGNSSDIMPGGYDGMGCTGYDNHTKKYFYTWIDNMSSSPMTATGTYDAATKTFTYNVEGFEPAMGKVCKTKHVITIKSDNEIYETFTNAEDNTKTMEMTMKRVK